MVEWTESFIYAHLLPSVLDIQSFGPYSLTVKRTSCLDWQNYYSLIQMQWICPEHLPWTPHCLRRPDIGMIKSWELVSHLALVLDWFRTQEMKRNSSYWTPSASQESMVGSGSFLSLNSLKWPCILIVRCFPAGAVVKNLPPNERDTREAGLIPALGRSPGEGNGYPLQYSALESSMDRGSLWATLVVSMGSQRVRHDWVTVISQPFLLSISRIHTWLLEKS